MSIHNVSIPLRGKRIKTSDDDVHVDDGLNVSIPLRGKRIKTELFRAENVDLGQCFHPLTGQKNQNLTYVHVDYSTSITVSIPLRGKRIKTLP